MSKSKIVAYVLVAVVLVVVIIVLVSGKKPASQTTMPAGTKTAPAQVTTGVTPVQTTQADVPAASLPQGFPSDVPIEAGAQITQNYNATTDGGLFQATRVFVTAKTLDANFSLYSDYLKSGGWTVTSTVNTPSNKVLVATKDGANLQIAITQNSVTKVNAVNITYSKQK